MSLLICEHPELITVGRNGSRAHIRLTGQELARRQLEVRWVNRGGGCVLHAPGQLAIYPIVPLESRGWNVGQYMSRLQQALLETLTELRYDGRTRDGHYGIWGRTGQLAHVGVAVRDWITCHGAFLNVNPPRSVFGFVDSLAPEEAVNNENTTMSSLFAERGRPIKMPLVRSTLIEKLSGALSCGRFHLYTGHPLLSQVMRPKETVASRAC